MKIAEGGGGLQEAFEGPGGCLLRIGEFGGEGAKHFFFGPKLSAPSPGDDLWSKSAICLRGQTLRSDSFWEIGCDFSAVSIRLRLRCILR